MHQDTTTPTFSASDIINMSAEDFILHKIRLRLDEITALKEDYFKITGKAADHVLNGEKTSQFIYPSTKELETNIAKFLGEIGLNSFKTNQIISRFHPQNMTKDIRNELTRRYSGRLTLMKKANLLFSKKIDGEKGDLFCKEKQILELL